jgi:adenylate kinase family enzyme
MVSHMAQFTIILGVPASGKTTLARRLAADLSLARLCAPHTASSSSR